MDSIAFKLADLRKTISLLNHSGSRNFITDNANPLNVRTETLSPYGDHGLSFG